MPYHVDCSNEGWLPAVCCLYLAANDNLLTSARQIVSNREARWEMFIFCEIKLKSREVARKGGNKCNKKNLALVVSEFPVGFLHIFHGASPELGPDSRGPSQVVQEV